MTATDIPEDLVEEILSRVPAASMKRLRSTCKRWNTLFRDGRFSKKHSGKAPKQSLILMCNDYRICPMSVILNVAPPLIDLKDALCLNDSPSNNSKQVDIEEVFHCDGLLLCTTKDDRLVVWNPCLGETRWIKHKDSCDESSEFALGYENTKSGRSYKILRYWWKRKTNDEWVVGFEIYEFSSDTWKVLDDVTLECLEPPYDGLSLKGNTYWVHSYRTNDDLLYCFDFTKERFKSNRCLPQFQNCYGGWRPLSFVGEEKLCVLDWNITSPEMTNIWVTDKIDTDTEAALTWSKVFTVDSVHYRYPMSFVLDEEKKVALFCNASNKTNELMVCTIGEDVECYREIPYKEESTNKSWSKFILSYVPSLVQIQQ